MIVQKQSLYQVSYPIAGYNLEDNMEQILEMCFQISRFVQKNIDRRVHFYCRGKRKLKFKPKNIICCTYL